MSLLQDNLLVRETPVNQVPEAAEPPKENAFRVFEH
jgi:hypothetical protein